MKTIQEQVTLQAQHAKDITFKITTSPIEFAKMQINPTMALQLSVRNQNLEPNVFEVILKFTAQATGEGKNIYLLELEYSGTFLLTNIDSTEDQEKILLIRCPNLLFPFARQVMANLTRECGYPPLLINPIDFVALYEEQKKNSEGNVKINNISEEAKSKKNRK